jgi:hypothetical protein
MRITNSSLRALLWLLSVAGVTTTGHAQNRDTLRVSADTPSEPRALRLTEVLTIGQLDGPPEYAFGRLGRMTFGPDYGFYVYDRNDGQIRRYDPRGRFLNTVGRRGSGPGEYNNPAALGISPDSLLTVFDPSNLRVSYFAPNGSLRRALSMPRASWSGNGFITDNAGRLYLLASVPGGPSEGRGSRHQLLRYQASRLLDSMPVPPLTWGGFIMLTADGVRSPFRTEEMHSPYSPGGVILARSGQYRFVVDTGGPTVMLVTRNARPFRVQREELSEWRAYARYLGARSGMTSDVPDTKQLIRSLTSDNLGRIWVEVYVDAEKRTNLSPRPAARGPEITWRERTTSDLFSPAGVYLGRVTLPQDSQLAAVRDDHVLLLRQGPDDESLISVMRMPRP